MGLHTLLGETQHTSVCEAIINYKPVESILVQSKLKSNVMISLNSTSMMSARELPPRVVFISHCKALV